MMNARLAALAALTLGTLGVTAAHAEPRKTFYFRAGVARVTPLEMSREMELADVDGPASLAVQNGPIAGSGSTVSSAFAFAATLGWNTKWLDNRLSLETIIGVPFTVKFQATGTLADEPLATTALGLPTGVMALGPELGEAKALPVVLTGVYDITPGKRLRPYAGGGAALMFTTGAKVTNSQLTAVSQPEMSIAPAPGVVLQAGLDYKIASRVYARIDVKFIGLMLARARVEHVQVETPGIPLFETVEVGTAKMSVWVNPLIIQAGIGTDF
jgi:outer membrane protein W